MMIKKYDPIKAGMRPLLAKTLQNALSHRIAQEFPRIGGPRICQLCAEMIGREVGTARPLAVGVREIEQLAAPPLGRHHVSADKSGTDGDAHD